MRRKKRNKVSFTSMLLRFGEHPIRTVNPGFSNQVQCHTDGDDFCSWKKMAFAMFDRRQRTNPWKCRLISLVFGKTQRTCYVLFTVTFVVESRPENCFFSILVCHVERSQIMTNQELQAPNSFLMLQQNIRHYSVNLQCL